MATMATCLIGLGSNLGDRAATLEQACGLLDDAVGAVRAKSSWHATRSAGGRVGQPDYLNAAVLCETLLPPDPLLATLMRLEQQLGRQRTERWGPRTIDLDLLLYGAECRDTPSLILPHPRMAFRRFVLRPAAEIAPDMLHPPTGYTLRELLARIDVRPILVALLGERATMVGRAAASRLGATFLPRPLAAASDSSRPFGSGISERLHSIREDWERAVTKRTRAILSDFWIGEFVVREPEQAAVPQRDQWRTEWEQLPAPLAAPHVAIWLESGQPVAAPERDRLSGAVRELRPFPMLRLSGDTSIESAVAEATAAVEAIEESDDGVHDAHDDE